MVVMLTGLANTGEVEPLRARLNDAVLHHHPQGPGRKRTDGRPLGPGSPISRAGDPHSPVSSNASQDRFSQLELRHNRRFACTTLSPLQRPNVVAARTPWLLIDEAPLVCSHHTAFYIEELDPQRHRRGFLREKEGGSAVDALKTHRSSDLYVTVNRFCRTVNP